MYRAVKFEIKNPDKKQRDAWKPLTLFNRSGFNPLCLLNILGLVGDSHMIVTRNYQLLKNFKDTHLDLAV